MDVQEEVKTHTRRVEGGEGVRYGHACPCCGAAKEEDFRIHDCRRRRFRLGDFEDGPCVLVGDQAVTTHLSAFIDCHSRYVVEARYYLRENLDILIDSLLRAWAIHGASRELYLDNAKIYHAHALKAACFGRGLGMGRDFGLFVGRGSSVGRCGGPRAWNRPARHVGRRGGVLGSRGRCRDLHEAVSASASVSAFQGEAWAAAAQPSAGVEPETPPLPWRLAAI